MADIGLEQRPSRDDMPYDSVPEGPISESAVLPQQQHHVEDDLKNQDSGEEYSSGSDRSIDADESSRYDRSGEEVNGEVPLVAARIRSKKHRHGSHGSRRHKGGQRHKYRSGFQPYPDTGDLETSLKRKSLELQEKENAAALLRKEGGEDQFVTFPVAPFNSTQFLMDEHSLGSTSVGMSKTEFSACHSPKICSQDVALNSVTSTPIRTDLDANDVDMVRLAEYSSRNIDKEFSDFYTSIHAESLQSMPKDELVKHYMSLEEQVAALQKKVAEAEQRTGSVFSDCAKTVQPERFNDKDCATGSDTNSLSSGNEDFVDLSSINPSAEGASKREAGLIQS